MIKTGVKCYVYIYSELFYVRNHLPVPEVDDSHQLEVASFGNERLTLNVEDLKTKYPQHTVTAVLQCAGNRRSEMNKVSLQSLTLYADCILQLHLFIILTSGANCLALYYICFIHRC